jgi:hypothetical protein
MALPTISPSHLQRLRERVGREWRDARDAEVQQYREHQRPRGYAGPPATAAVMLDGGRSKFTIDRFRTSIPVTGTRINSPSGSVAGLHSG